MDLRDDDVESPVPASSTARRKAPLGVSNITIDITGDEDEENGTNGGNGETNKNGENKENGKEGKDGAEGEEGEDGPHGYIYEDDDEEDMQEDEDEDEDGVEIIVSPPTISPIPSISSISAISCIAIAADAADAAIASTVSTASAVTTTTARNAATTDAIIDGTGHQKEAQGNHTVDGCEDSNYVGVNGKSCGNDGTDGRDEKDEKDSGVDVSRKRERELETDTTSIAISVDSCSLDASAQSHEIRQSNESGKGDKGVISISNGYLTADIDCGGSDDDIVICYPADGNKSKDDTNTTSSSSSDSNGTTSGVVDMTTGEDIVDIADTACEGNITAVENHTVNSESKFKNAIDKAAERTLKYTEEDVPEVEGRVVLRAILQEIIEKSGLIGIMDSNLRNESFIDMENHSELFYLIFQVIHGFKIRVEAQIRVF